MMWSHSPLASKKLIWLNLRALRCRFRGGEPNGEVIEGTERPRDMVSTKWKRRREGTDTEPALVKALRQEVEELKIAKVEAGDPPASVKALRQEVEGLKLRKPKVEAESQTQKEKETEVKLPKRAWAIIAGKIHPNDVCSFALVSSNREAKGGRAGVRRTLLLRSWWFHCGHFMRTGAYWSRSAMCAHRF